MTSRGIGASSVEADDSQRENEARIVACSFCRKRLAEEYFFTCLKCQASCCYIHMSRHQPAACARQIGRRTRSEAAAAGPHPLGQSVPLLRAGSNAGSPGSSANV